MTALKVEYQIKVVKMVEGPGMPEAMRNALRHIDDMIMSHSIMEEIVPDSICFTDMTDMEDK